MTFLLLLPDAIKLHEIIEKSVMKSRRRVSQRASYFCNKVFSLLAL